MYKKLLTVIAPGRKTQGRVEKRFHLSLVPFVQFKCFICASMGFPGGSDSKEGAYFTGATGDSGLIPGSGRSLGNGNPLQNFFFQAINYIF